MLPLITLTPVTLGPLVPLAVRSPGLLVIVTVIVAARVAPQWTTALMSRRGMSDLLQPAASATRWQFVFLAVVLAPAVEELVFRGLVLRHFVASRGFWRGILLSAGIFALPSP